MTVVVNFSRQEGMKLAGIFATLVGCTHSIRTSCVLHHHGLAISPSYSMETSIMHAFITWLSSVSSDPRRVQSYCPILLTYFRLLKKSKPKVTMRRFKTEPNCSILFDIRKLISSISLLSLGSPHSPLKM